MKRILLVMSVAALMAAMLMVVAGPASAQGCGERFGMGFVAGNAPHGELASTNAQLNDEILSLHAALCD